MSIAIQFPYTIFSYPGIASISRFDGASVGREFISSGLANSWVAFSRIEGRDTLAL